MRQNPIWRGIGWDYAPTFMVASIKKQGIKAITTRNAITLHMNFFKNGLFVQDGFQSIFNDYRTTRNTTPSAELSKVKGWNKLGYSYR